VQQAPGEVQQSLALGREPLVSLAAADDRDAQLGLKRADTV
jgi:hypothetical protein